MRAHNDCGPLVEFAFVSSMDAALPQAALGRLVGQAWRYNTRSGLTGAMEIDGRKVRQVIEGDVATVLPLASRILSDPRHGRIRVLSFGPVPARRHVGWRVTGLHHAFDADANVPTDAVVVPLHRPALPESRAAGALIA
jgi:hypothetical protein